MPSAKTSHVLRTCSSTLDQLNAVGVHAEQSFGPPGQDQRGLAAAVEGVRRHRLPARDRTVLPAERDLQIVVGDERQGQRSSIGQDRQGGQRRRDTQIHLRQNVAVSRHDVRSPQCGSPTRIARWSRAGPCLALWSYKGLYSLRAVCEYKRFRTSGGYRTTGTLPFSQRERYTVETKRPSQRTNQ